MASETMAMPDMAKVSADPHGALVGAGVSSGDARDLLGLPGFDFSKIFAVIQLIQKWKASGIDFGTLSGMVTDLVAFLKGIFGGSNTAPPATGSKPAGA